MAHYTVCYFTGQSGGTRIKAFDDNDNLIETLDVFLFINHYVSYCRDHGIPINKKLWA
jgi:hypothetical protein